MYEKEHWHTERGAKGPKVSESASGSPTADLAAGSTRSPIRLRRHLPPEVLSKDEAARLLAACENGGLTGLRNAALIALLYRAGLRVGETMALAPKDLDLKAGAIRVLHAKGSRSRTVGIDPTGAAHVTAWLGSPAGLLLPPAAPLFCTAYGDPLTPGYARLLLKRLGERAGIAKRVHPHGLRHTHAAELRAEGVDIAIISKQLGHRSIAATARYLDHIAPTDVIRALRERG